MIAPDKGRNMRGAMGANGMKASGWTPDNEGNEDESAEGSMAGSTATVPLDSLGDTPPQVGDTVNFSVEGTVKSIQGSNAVIDIDTVNGDAGTNDDDTGDEEGESTSPGADYGPPAGKESLSAMGARLRKKAASSSGGY